MSAAAHTPGPWQVNRHDAFQVCDCDGDARGCAPIAYIAADTAAKANARLIVAAPELLAAQTMGVEVNTPDFLDWIADRLVHVHRENPNVDFVMSLRERAKAGRAAIAKATGSAA